MQHVKCVVVGDGGVGKSCLMVTAVTGSFPSEYMPCMFGNNTVSTTVEGKSVEVCIWDTAGSSEYDRIRPMSYPDTGVFLVCFSITSPESFESVRTKWHPEINQHCPGTPIILLGTKLDLRDNPGTLDSLKQGELTVVTQEQGRKLASQIGAAGFVECSALTQDGLSDVFEKVARVGIGLSLKGSDKKDKCSIM